MERSTIEPAIQSIMSDMRLKLDEAARIAKAAKAWPVSWQAALPKA